MKKYLGTTLFVIGILFVINAIFGRYIVLPGYLESMEAGSSTNIIPESVPVLKILRYLLWAFSYKLGIFFVVLGVLFLKNRSLKDRIVFAIVGLFYIITAYMDWPNYHSLFFGVGGVLITLSIISIFWTMNHFVPINGRANILKELGYFFLVMASYNLCPLLGVKAFALEPEKMIRYNLQSTAVSFANHIVVELAIGFILLAIYYQILHRKGKNIADK